MNLPYEDMIIIYAVLKTLSLKLDAFSFARNDGMKLGRNYEQVEWRFV